MFCSFLCLSIHFYTNLFSCCCYDVDVAFFWGSFNAYSNRYFLKNKIGYLKNFVRFRYNDKLFTKEIKNLRKLSSPIFFKLIRISSSSIRIWIYLRLYRRKDFKMGDDCKYVLVNIWFHTCFHSLLYR